MKKIFKLSFFALLLSMAACSDATDIIQESELPEDLAFQNVEDLQSGLSGVYAAYGPDFGGNGDGDAILFNDLFTDNIKSGLSNNGQGSSEYNFILQPNTTGPVSIWGNRYATINRVNRVLRAYDRIYPTLPTEDVPGTEEDIFGAQRIKGQLLAMRALCHFDLFEYYTVDYDNLAGLSVIKMDFVPELDDSTFERNTVGEILDFINSDITESYTLLGDVNATSVNFINVNVVKAIQARVALITGDYILAETLTTELVAAVPPSDPATYQGMFRDEANGEIIFSLIRTPQDNGVAGLFYANAVRRSGSPIFEVSRQLYDLLDDADVRKDVIIVPESEPTGSSDALNILLIGKYPGIEADALVNDVKIFRSSEMLLILAEAQARSGNLPGATASIQALVNQRYTGVDPILPQFVTLNDALTRILLERRKELAFEGHRYLDLKRLGGELNIGISRLPLDADTFGAPTDLAPNDYRFTFPIPQSELNANNIITQNPGYPVNN